MKFLAIYCFKGVTALAISLRQKVLGEIFDEDITVVIELAVVDHFVDLRQ